MKQEEQPAPPVEGKLVPILREGVEIVKLIFFKELQNHVAGLFPDEDRGYHNRLTGAVINRCFGVENPDPAIRAFVEQESARIDEVMAGVGSGLENLRIPLTDALRITVLCDYQEGRDTSELLARARDAGLLIADRDMPMPHTFIELVRRIGQAYGVLTPPPAPQ